MLIVCNLSDQEQPATLSLPDFVGRRPIEVLTNQPFPQISEMEYQLSLTPYQYCWLKLTGA
jgi:maltose alpha-D-glucosyltransferase/alpha-amylase